MMITTRTVCFVCFILHFTSLEGTNTTIENKAGDTTKTTETTHATSISNTSIKPTTSIPKNPHSTKGSYCTTPSPEPSKEYCIFSLPKNNTLILVLVALTVACFTLLLITLVCACQVCHLKRMMSRFHHRSVDLHGVRKRSESLCKDDGREKGQPTETCLMLSELTVQEDGNEEESEHQVQLSTEPPVEGPNGDVTQEEGNGCEFESKGPYVGAPEISDTVV